MVLLLAAGCSTNPDADKTLQTTDTHHSRKHQIIKPLRPISTTASTITESAIEYKNTSSVLGTIGQLIEENIGLLKEYQVAVAGAKKPELKSIDYYEPYEKKQTTQWQFRVLFDNDIFNNTDYYYTNGLAFELVIPSLNHSLVRKIFFAPKNISIEQNGFSLRQNMYTPTNPDTEVILEGDWPFSSFLTFGQFREVYDLKTNIFFRSELNIGVIGPSSLGGIVQSEIHEITPVGWKNQIGNDFILDYRVSFKKGLLNNNLIDLNVSAGGNVGTLYDRFEGGFEMRLGHFLPFFNGPITIFNNESDSFQFWFFASGKSWVSIYDATLSGGLFNKDNPYTIPYADINRFGYQASAGVALFYDKVGFEYEQIYISPKFNGAKHFGWGSIKLIFAF